MKRAIGLSIAALLLAAPAAAQTTTPPAATTTPSTPGTAQTTTNIPAQSMALSNWYGKSVYDQANNKIGDISDVLIDQQKQASLAIIGVGGFLGIGEKNVAVPFDTITRSVRDGSVYLTMNTTKDALNAAQGLRFDRTTNSWLVDAADGSGRSTMSK
ncbi:MAG: PRC-barrel domain-containing protein [Hyphomicrobiaceae bacterium]|nr:PRC-barrel domain-containing protein [Hyphomicrobiaceae bacterium]